MVSLFYDKQEFVQIMDYLIQSVVLKFFQNYNQLFDQQNFEIVHFIDFPFLNIR